MNEYPPSLRFAQFIMIIDWLLATVLKRFIFGNVLYLRQCQFDVNVCSYCCSYYLSLSLALSLSLILKIKALTHLWKKMEKKPCISQHYQRTPRTQGSVSASCCLRHKRDEAARAYVYGEPRMPQKYWSQGEGGGQQCFQISTCLLESEGGQVIKARGREKRAKRKSRQGLLRSWRATDLVWAKDGEL